MEFRFKSDSITQKMKIKGKKKYLQTFWKIWGVHRCPSLLLSRLKAELSGKENTPNFEKCPSQQIWTGCGRIILKNMAFQA